jgi:hypothetical protein
MGLTSTEVEDKVMPTQSLRPRSRAAEQADDLAPFPLMEMHPFPQAQGTYPRISEAGPAR